MGASSFNEMEIDAIGEIMNISLGASATAVSTMLGTMVNITTPVVKVLNGHEFEFKKLEPAVGVEIAYVEGLAGSNVMMFSRNDVRLIVGMLMGCEIPEENFELDEINRSAICEVMNQMMGSSATALSEFLGMPVNISTPISFEISDEISFKEKYFPTEANKVVVRFSLEVEGVLKSEFLNIMSVELAKLLLEPFGLSTEEPEESQGETDVVPAVQEEKPSASDHMMTQEEIQKLMQSQMEPEPPVSSPSSDHMMTQEEIQKLMQSQMEPEPPVSSPSSNHMMTQEEIQKLMQSQMEPEPESSVQQAAPVQQTAPVQQAVPQQPVYSAIPQPVYAPAPDPLMLQLLNQMQQSQMQMLEMMRDIKTKEKEKPKDSEPSLIHPMNSAHLDDDDNDGVEDHANQEMLMKVPLEISVEIGRTKKRVKDILEFTQGSLVVLDKMAGEQADLYVNGQCIARGDIVVVEDNFGIRITEIVARNLNPESL